MSDVVLFYGTKGKYGCFSNFYPCTFVCDGVSYHCSEQYMMHQKALLFRNFDIAEAILAESDPLAMKKLGRQVRNYSEKWWGSKRVEIMRIGLKEKFKQNPELLEVLMSTEDAIIGEAAPRDVIWGTGKGKNCINPNEWRGQNLLGKILMMVREDIKNER